MAGGRQRAAGAYREAQQDVVLLGATSGRVTKRKPQFIGCVALARALAVDPDAIFRVAGPGLHSAVRVLRGNVDPFVKVALADVGTEDGARRIGSRSRRDEANLPTVKSCVSARRRGEPYARARREIPAMHQRSRHGGYCPPVSGFGARLAALPCRRSTI